MGEARLERVAADGKKVGLSADALLAQHLLEDGLQLRLQLAGGRHILLRCACAPVRRRQRLQCNGMQINSIDVDISPPSAMLLLNIQAPLDTWRWT